MDTYVKCLKTGLTSHLTRYKVYQRIQWGRGLVMVCNDVGNHADYDDCLFSDPFTDVVLDTPKPIKHKCCKLIHAFADGAIIQWRRPNGDWFDCFNNQPSWEPDNDYRVKPSQAEIAQLKDHIVAIQRDRDMSHERIAADRIAIHACDETLQRLRRQLYKLNSGE